VRGDPGRAMSDLEERAFDRRPPSAPKGASLAREAIPLALLAALFVEMALTIARAPQYLHCDQALNLYCGRMLLEGKLPYVDFIDLNPPLIMYLSALPHLLARALPVGPIPIFSFAVLGLAGWSSWSLRAQLKRAGEPLSEMATLLTLVWAGVTLELLAVGKPYGQREHLFMLLYLPFFALRLARWSGRSLVPARAIALGVAAGVGACLKPFFLASALLPELSWILMHRRKAPLKAPELGAFVGVSLVYAAHFLFLPEGVRASLFGRWIPFVARHYGVYDATVTQLFQRPTFDVLRGTGVVALSALVVLLAYALRRAPIGALVKPLAAFVLGASASFFLQHKGWPYHQIPTKAAALLACAAAALHLAGRLPVEWRRAAALGLVLVYCGYAATKAATPLFHGRADPNLPLKTALAQHTRPGDEVMVLSTSVIPTFATIVELDRKNGSRYLWNFPLPMLYQDDPVGTPFSYHPERGEEARYVAELAQDLQRRPRLLVLESSVHSEATPQGFRVIDWVKAAGLFERSIAPFYTHVGEVALRPIETSGNQLRRYQLYLATSR
jgi:hypothetical protein